MAIEIKTSLGLYITIAVLYVTNAAVSGGFDVTIDVFLYRLFVIEGIFFTLLCAGSLLRSAYDNLRGWGADY